MPRKKFSRSAACRPNWPKLLKCICQKLFFLNAIAELEKSLIQERTKAGRAAAQARGVKMGCKPKLSPQQVAHVRKLLEQGEHPRDVARLLKVSQRTVERALATTQLKGLLCQFTLS